MSHFSPASSFIYFDLGKVLIEFDHQKACKQIAQLCGLEDAMVWNFLFNSGLSLKYESGEITSAELFAEILKISKKSFLLEELLFAASDIFSPKSDIISITDCLLAQGYRLGILSNTSPAHWEYCLKKYAFLNNFSVTVLSYEVKLLKPGLDIFRHALKKAGVSANQCFYTDDIDANAEAAKSLGIHSFTFKNATKLTQDLAQVGVQL